MNLRTLSIDDVDHVLGIFSDPIATKYFQSTSTRSQVLERLQRNLDRYEADGYGFWGCIRQSDGEYLGNCGLLRQEVEGRDYIEVGYHFLRKHWGQGYASEAALACRDHAFRELGADQVISLIVSANEPSIRVAQRNGMTLSFQTHMWDMDLGVYMITRSEWESLING